MWEIKDIIIKVLRSINPQILAHTAIFSYFMQNQYRKNIKPGMEVEIVLKKDQATGKLTNGIVKTILTSSLHHSRGIKVKLDDGQVGRVQKILTDEIGNPLED